MCEFEIADEVNEAIRQLGGDRDCYGVRSVSAHYLAYSLISGISHEH
jgi:hypothetical protein